MARIDTPSEKAGFKKRAHRPWKPSLLEKAIRETSPIETDEHEAALDTCRVNPQPKAVATPAIEILESPTENAHSQLSIGGFSKAILSRPPQTAPPFNPTGLYESTNSASNRKAGDHKLHFALLEQISSLEQDKDEIMAMSAQLKKQLQQSGLQLQEMERQKNAALNDRSQLEEKLKSALEQFVSGESARVNELERQRQLVMAELMATEDKLKQLDNQNKDLKEQLMQTETARVKIEAAEKLAVNQFEAEFAARLKIEALKDTTEQLLKDKQARLDALMQTLDTANQQQERLETQKTQLEQRVQEQIAELNQLEDNFFKAQHEQKLTAESLKKTTELKNDLQASIDAALSARDVAIEEFHVMQNQLTKMQAVLKTERNLRKLAEEKAGFAIERAQQSELARQVEMNVRRRAEEKAESAMTETSKALMHILSSPSNRPS